MLGVGFFGNLDGDDNVNISKTWGNVRDYYNFSKLKQHKPLFGKEC